MRNRRRGKVKLSLISFLLVIFSLTVCTPPPNPNARVVLIFSDVTSSLVPSENEQVGTLTCSVVNALPNGTRYYVYPVQIEPQKLYSIDEGVIVSERTPAADEAVKSARKKRISDRIKELYNLIKSTKMQADLHAKPDNHSCILYTLYFAQNVFKQFDPTKTDFELIYVSDMIEECNATPLGKPVSLAHPDISDEIELAKQTDLELDLSYARVSVIIPATNDTYVTRGRPNVSDLRAFWEAVLMHCGFNESSLKNNEKFYFASGLPMHLKTRQTGL